MRRLVGAVACASVSGAFLFTFLDFLKLLAFRRNGRRLLQTVFAWFAAGRLDVALGLQFDPLSATMLLFVTGVGALIHFYSLGYMAHDRGYARYFAYLNLFTFSMILLVLGDGLLPMFVGWEGVGSARIS